MRMIKLDWQLLTGKVAWPKDKLLIHEEQDKVVTKWDEGQQGSSDTLGLWSH